MTIKTSKRDMIVNKAFYKYEVYPIKKLSYVSESILDITGYTSEDFQSDEELIFNITHEEDRIKINNLLSGNEIFENPLYIKWIHKNGSTLFVEQFFYPIKKDARIISFESIVHLSSDTIKSESLTDKKEDFFNYFFDNTYDVYYESDIEGKLLEVSPSISVISKGQYSREEVLGKPIDDFYVNPADREKLLSILIKEGQVNDYEIVLKNKDSSIMYCSLSSRLYYDKSDNPVKIIGNIKDITSKKMNEQKMDSYVKLLRAYYENNPSAIFMWVYKDNELILSDVNQTALNITDGKAKDFIGLKASFIYKNQPNILEQLKSCYSTKRTIEYETKYYSYSFNKSEWTVFRIVYIEPDKVIMFSNNINALKNSIASNSARLNLIKYSDSHSINEIIEKSLNQIEQLIENDFSFFYFVNEEKQTFSIELCSKKGRKEFASAVKLGKSFNTDGNFTLFESKSPNIFNDINSLNKVIYMPSGNREAKSYLYFPLLKSDKITSAIVLGSYNYEFSNEEIKSISHLATLLYELIIKKQTEKKLALSELRYSTFVNQSNVGIYLLNLKKSIDIKLTVEEQKDLIVQDAYIAECNDSFAKMYGADSAAEMLNKKLFDLHGGKNIENIKEIKKFVENGYEIRNADSSEVTFDGKKVWFSNYSIGIIEDNKLVQIWGTQIDITDKKMTDEKLRHSELTYSKMIKNLGDVIAIIDKNGITTYKSPNIKKWFGWDPEDLIGKSGLYAIHPDDYEYAEKVLISLIKGNNTENKIELRYRRKDGNYEWIEYTAVNLLNDPDINGILGNYHSIEYRKRAEAELLKSKKIAEENEFRFKSLHNASFGGIAIHDKGIILDCNKGLSDITGYSIDQLLGMNGLMLIAEETRNLVLEKINSGYEKPYEAVGIRKSGEKYPLRLEAREIPYKGKSVRCVEFRDNTDYKRAEIALVESQRLKAIGEMSSAVAHDFNNSLQSISSYIELALLNSKEKNKVEKYLDVANKATIDAAHRVQILQRFGGKKQKDVLFKNEDINALIEEVIIQARPIWKDQSEKNGISITIEKAMDEIEKIYCNGSDIKSVIFNLLKNSIEAMPEGGKIKIDTSVSGENVFISIKDSGIGMDDETIYRIFQPFYTTKGFESGRGLGLSGSYTIIQEHNGKIYVKESSPEKGTTIVIELPMTNNHEMIEDSQKVKEFKDSVNIIWVDDDQVIRDAACEMLETFGHKGDVVESGEEAIKLLNEKKYDLLFTDIGMPGMNGWQLINIVNDKFKHNMKIVVLSGWGSEISKESMQEYNIDYILEKPFRIRQLEELINIVMNK